MGLLRSETMKRGTLVVPNERARAVVHELGSRTRIQFEDMNAQSLRRAYKTAVQRIEECERIVRFLVEQVDAHGEPIVRNPEEFLEQRPHYKFEEVEAELKRAYSQLLNARDNNRGLIDQHARILEEKYVVIVAASQTNYGGGLSGRSGIDSGRGLLGVGDVSPGISNAAGVIGRGEQDRFARALFRMSRGNTFTSFHPISDPIPDESGKPSLRSVFVVYFQGGATSVMAEKVSAVCNAYGGRIYSWPASAEDAEQRFQDLNGQLADSKVSQEAYDRFVATEMSYMLTCPRPGGSSLIEDWRLFLMVEKSIYTTLNHFEATEHTLKCDCWYADDDEDHIRRVLIDESPPYGVSAMLLPGRTYEHADPHAHGDPSRNPPTYIKSNGMTKIIQEIVDTYATPGYKEANPMVLSLVTFPFIFGVMFGDIGHGLLLFLAGVYLNLKGQALVQIDRDSSHPLQGYGKVMFDARYLILMMGLFAFYAGLLYNDFLSLGLDLFGSRYKEGPVTEHGVEWIPKFDVTNAGGPGPYPFGLDPAWHGAENQLLFVNSMKMKIAVLLGVVQMLAGTMLSFSNAVYEKSTIDFVFVCMPQVVFMTLFFGYMDFLIVYKWTHVGNQPSIINTMISMGLMQDLAPSQELFPGQNSFQQLNLVLLMLCVPWMLFPKPAALYWQHQQQITGYAPVHGHDDETASYAGSYSKGKEMEAPQFDFGEIVIHQVIETIEFVLGSISHTASYLRLWALSLAHQQLSSVFFQKIMLSALATGSAFSCIAIFIATACFIGVSVGFLMGVDNLECTLHTLRLHWVEFQSKFYKGGGHMFQPYSHERVVLRVES
jgi:V-type H+-transporting ATPase subunit a